MTFSAPSPNAAVGGIVPHAASGGPRPSDRARAVLACLADRPMPVLVHYLGHTLVAADPAERIGPADLWSALDERVPGRGGPDPVAGALIGMLGYDLAGRIERLPEPHAADGVPQAALGRFETVAVEDPRGRWRVASCGSRRAARELERIVERAPAFVGRPLGAAQSAHQSLSRAEHLDAVERAREWIRAGDCYQVNLATRLEARCSYDPLSFAQALWHAAGDARHAAFVGLDGGAVVSASPERLLAVEGRSALTEPIKGSAPRDDAGERLLSAKNRAEHVMIVDLMRNDLGRVSRRGGVRVDKLMMRRPTPYIDHLVSEVRAELAPGVSCGDLVRAVFPGGSVTGAPKVRAMEIIHELEPVSRGPAYGSVVAVGSDGSMDASVAIRTAWLDPDRALYWSGGAIVWDSEAVEEYEEALLKATPFLTAVGR